MNKIILLFLLTPFTFHLPNAHAQNPDLKRTYHWYFGNKAGLDFSSGSPVAVTDGEMNVLGNPVSMSDTAGNLQFYSDRYNVWNRNHETMPNGTGLIGGQGTNSFSHALCVQKPGADNVYYMFYWQYISITELELEYAVIDMSLDGGLGDVVSSQNSLMYMPMDGFAATKHSNGEDVWLTAMRFGTNTFHSFLISSSGIDTTAVTSSAGISGNALYQLKFSPQGSKLGATWSIVDQWEVLDFDNASGIVSNAVIFPSCTSDCEAYGVEFSPDGSKIYFSVNYFNTFPKGGGALYQYELTNNANSTIASKVLLDTVIVNDTVTFNANLGIPRGIQLGPDGQIYIVVNSLSQMASIHNPNGQDPNCAYEYNALSLSGAWGHSGLPEFVSSYYSGLVSLTELTETGQQILSYPNPFQEATTLILPFEGEVQLELIDMMGKQYTAKSSVSRSGILTLYRDHLPAGKYILKIEHNNNTYTHKIAITN